MGSYIVISLIILFFLNGTKSLSTPVSLLETNSTSLPDLITSDSITTTASLLSTSKEGLINNNDSSNESGNESNDFQCFSKEEIEKRRVTIIGNPESPIHIQVTNRVTHQLMSRIFKIFLNEILGYENVTLIKLQYNRPDEKYKIYITLKSLIPPSKPVTTPLIDLEVWMQFGSDAWPWQLSQVGLVTEPGRFGWFVPNNVTSSYSTMGISRAPNYSSLYNISEFLTNILHYKIFLYPESEIYQRFFIEDEVLNYIKKFFGFEKEFIPDNCKNRRCVTILSEYFVDTGFVKYHIEELELYTNVLWIGEKFKFATLWLYKHYNENPKLFLKNRKYILLHWTPSDIIETDIYDSIIMPKCQEMISSNRTLCKYEMTPLLKYFGSNSRTLTTELRTLEKFHISRYELRKLLMNTNNILISNNLNYNNIESNYNSNKDIYLESIYNKVACDWLRENEKIYSKWIIKEPAKIIIGGIFPKSRTGDAYKDIVPAARMAVEAINQNNRILQNYSLILMEHDGQCKSDIVMKAFISYFKGPSPLIGILGPACSDTIEPIAGISKHTRMVVVSYSAEGSSFLDREAYPYIFRTIGSNRQYEAVYLNFFKHLKWRRIAALTEDGQKYTEYISHLETLLKQNDMELIVNKKFPKEVTASEMKRHLLDLKRKNAKIIIADVYNNNAEKVMCEAYKLKMTAENGYVWFLPVWLSKSWSNIKNFEDKDVDCTPEQFYEAIEGHFSLAHAPLASNSSIMQENRSVEKWISDFNRENHVPTNYAGFAYDAVWVYAMAADKLLRENPTYINQLQSPKIVDKFVDIIWKTDFNGVSGRIRFGEGGSRIDDINILQWLNGKFHKIGNYIPEIDESTKPLKIRNGKLEINETSIIWKSKDGKPKDGTFVCQLGAIAEFFDTDCDNITLILTTLLCLFFVIIVSLASFMFWKRQYNRKIKQTAKVMRNFGIDLLSPSSNMTNTLDKWEIPKEKVVINRRLGEGAFGTVYGGEAQFSESGWTAVAVKTLKIGASMEDRLDFLSEAEAMKRFDHENIVKLLGVCLQTEPVYTIMEFMLYGDLKTFLLARRHLVNEKVTDDSDISPKRLTMMAMDVARGLSYLAEQKYVHRDIACRNCLVNAQRVVKIGDFGMARPMFENDYYRFNRKGMLPVRWMSPESLSLGLFTPSSDVWSFGVLLYEIITFGSFPYQGLTNNQVLEYIKNGKTLDIPHGTKPHLEGLMRACWNPEAKKRPTASEIVEYISNYSRLLTPCLDIPISSVQMPETESDQMELLPKLRRRITAQPNLDILAKATNINNFDQKSNSDNLSAVHDNALLMENLNVLPETNTQDDSNINITYYSPMEPLLRYNPDISNSSLSLRRYVPMYGLVASKKQQQQQQQQQQKQQQSSSTNNLSNYMENIRQEATSV